MKEKKKAKPKSKKELSVIAQKAVQARREKHPEWGEKSRQVAETKKKKLEEKQKVAIPPPTISSEDEN